MGMDGLSMANTGALKEATSADYANRNEQVMQSDPTNNNKQVQNVDNNKRVREKDEEDSSEKKQEQNAQKDEFQDGLITETEEEEENNSIDVDDFENPNKDFYVKLNAKDDIIELYETSSDKLIETISGNELQELVKKLNMASGIFINKKV